MRTCTDFHATGRRCLVLVTLVLSLGGMGWAAAESEATEARFNGASETETDGVQSDRSQPSTETATVRFHRLPTDEAELWRARIRTWLARSGSHRMADPSSSEPSIEPRRLRSEEPLLHVVFVQTGETEGGGAGGSMTGLTRGRGVHCAPTPDEMPLLSPELESELKSVRLEAGP